MDDLKKSKYYNRDLSWLLFNRRVIDQAGNKQTPLLERLKFLAIASNNLDEFYSVRVPGIQELVRVAPDALDEKTGQRQREIQDQLAERNKSNVQQQYRLYNHIIEKLEDDKILFIEKYADLSDDSKAELDEYFEKNIFPGITTLQFNQYHAKPHYVDGELNIYIRSRADDEDTVSVIPISDKLDRLIELSVTDHYVFLEDVILNNIERILPNTDIITKFVFRITRDKDIELEYDAEESIVSWVKKYVNERERGRATRLEYAGDHIHQNSSDLQYLLGSLGLGQKSSYLISGPIDLTFLFGLTKKYGKLYPKLDYKPFKAVKPNKRDDLAAMIDEHDILLQHPYESFEYIVKLLTEAVKDPETIAIKQTIYRVADDSDIVAQLKKAAKKGIQVTVVIELKARFDEKNNISLIDELREAGCYVSYGKEDLKTHSKALLIVKQDGKRYAHLGTGNYNEDTANIYTDLSLLTSREEYVSDVENFFNYMVNDIDVPKYNLISTSPYGIKEMVLRNINKMKEHYINTGKGSIFFKTNALTDRDIIDAIYSAAEAGVPIRMVIRGACCLRLGLCGEKENIVISSIVGRFLEHSRIYGFYWDEDKPDLEGVDLWIASADLMTRNMEQRVEIATPIIDKELKLKLSEIVEIFSDDTKDAYFLDLSGHYQKVKVSNALSAQETFAKIATDEREELPQATINQKIADLPTPTDVKNNIKKEHDQTVILYVIIAVLAVVILFLLLT
jgi:polyphosphate kinase 1